MNLWVEDKGKNKMAPRVEPVRLNEPANESRTSQKCTFLLVLCSLGYWEFSVTNHVGSLWGEKQGMMGRGRNFLKNHLG